MPPRPQERGRAQGQSGAVMKRAQAAAVARSAPAGTGGGGSAPLFPEAFDPILRSMYKSGMLFDKVDLGSLGGPHIVLEPSFAVDQLLGSVVPRNMHKSGLVGGLCAAKSMELRLELELERMGYRVVAIYGARKSYAARAFNGGVPAEATVFKAATAASLGSYWRLTVHLGVPCGRTSTAAFAASYGACLCAADLGRHSCDYAIYRSSGMEEEVCTLAAPQRAVLLWHCLCGGAHRGAHSARASVLLALIERPARVHSYKIKARLSCVSAKNNSLPYPLPWRTQQCAQQAVVPQGVLGVNVAQQV
jgi:hypothetical protein